MSTYSYDGRSFIIDGQRVWLHDGEIHYYRFPRAEWRRLLTIAKAVGLNCVSTYIAWNYHELNEGEWNFEGDHDLAAFFDLAAELGLYVIARPGPYICAEWNGGGVPAWLLTKKGLRQRTDEENYIHYTQLWFRKFMEIAAPRQVTRGGNIIAIQNDNEYHGGWDEGTNTYIHRLHDILREEGAEVAITACNCHSNGNGDMMINYDAEMVDAHVYDDTIVTYNTCAPLNVPDQLRAFQPGKPLLVTELWTGPMVFWGTPVSGMPDESVAGWITEFAAHGAQICMYMFAGGTNHGYNGASNIATSYASAYPVGEGMHMTRKSYVIKPISAFLQAFGAQLTECGREVIEQADGVVRIARGEDGGFLFAFPKGSRMTLPLGAGEEVRFGDVKAGVFPLNLKHAGHTVDYSTLQLLARMDDTLYLYGEAGMNYRLSIDGKTYEVTVPAMKPLVPADMPLRVVVMDTYLARHFWRVQAGAVLGGSIAYDGEAGLCIEQQGDEPIVWLDNGRELTEGKPQPIEPRPALPELSLWQIDAGFGGDCYQSIPAPTSHEMLGVNEGYVWYKAHVYSEKGGASQLMATSCTNRVMVYVNGCYSGMLGEFRTVHMRASLDNPAADVHEMVTVRLQSGDNEIVLLSVDTGHAAVTVKPMGPIGPVYADARRFYPEEAIYLGRQMITPKALETLYSSQVKELCELDTMELHVPCAEDETFFIIAENIHCFATINGEDGRPIEMFSRPYETFNGLSGYLTYEPATVCRDNVVKLQYIADAQTVLAHTYIYIAKKNSELKEWQWSPFNELPVWQNRADLALRQEKDAGRLEPSTPVSAEAIGHLPTWYTVRFPRPETNAPIAFAPGRNAALGQLFLNGHNVGRVNGTIAQSVYYLPAAWLEDENTLTYFEEYGASPAGSKLVYLHRD